MVVSSTRAMTRTTPVVCGAETRARAVPPRVLVWDGAIVMLLTHPASTAKVTGTSLHRAPLRVLHLDDHLGDLRVSPEAGGV